MNVAIIGTGLSGLSCALELEKHGITPVIFEKKDKIGDDILVSTVSLSNLLRIYSNPFTYLQKQYGLQLTPLNKLNKIIIHSQKNKVIIKGNIGHVLARGYKNNSLENQIYSKITTPILFGNLVNLNDIKNNFDYIVVATGNPNFAKKLGVWNESFNARVRTGIIKGNFETSMSKVWFNTEVSKSGFSFLIPENNKSAAIGLIVNNTTSKELNHYWHKLLDTHNEDYNITETFDVEHYCGYIQSNKLDDNIYFTGNAGGFTDSFIGVGFLNAIESGILAAKSIAKNLDYYELVQPIIDHIEKLNQFRKTLNDLNNTDFDRVVKAMHLPFIKRFIYLNPLFKATMLSPLLTFIDNNKT